MLKNFRWSLFGSTGKKDNAGPSPCVKKEADVFHRQFLESWCSRHDSMSLEFLSADSENTKKQQHRDFENSIRLVVFYDGATRRELLFDSKTLMKLPEVRNEVSSPSGTSNPKPLSRSATIPAKLSDNTTACRWKLGSLLRAQEHLRPYTPKYSHSKQANDINMLRELVFGNVELNYKGSTVKVHTTRCPIRIFTSKTFLRDPHNHSSLTSSLSDTTTINRSISLSHFIDTNSATPSCSLMPSSCRGSPAVHVVKKFLQPECGPKFILGNSPHTAASSLSSAGIPEEVDDETSTPSTTSSPNFSVRQRNSFSAGTRISESTGSPSRSPSKCCYGSTGMSMRLTKALITSISSQLLFPRPDSSMAQQAAPSCRRRPDRYGVCIIYQPFHDDCSEEQQRFYDFYFTHNAFFEALLNEICQEILQAFSLDPQATRTDPLESVLQSLSALRKKVRRLYYAPLLTNPAWLTLSNGSVHPLLSSVFVHKCLSPALNQLNHPHQGQFVSALLSAVLTYHLSWIESVSMQSDEVALCAGGCQVTPEAARACCPQWVQLCQLYGVLGFPRCLARTVVIGSNETLVLFVIYLISYFIRCNDILRKLEQVPDLTGKEDQIPSEFKSSVSSSASSSSEYSSDLGHSPRDCLQLEDRSTESPSSDYHSDDTIEHPELKSFPLPHKPTQDVLIQVPLSLLSSQNKTGYSDRHPSSLGRSLIRGVTSKLVPFSALQGTTDRSLLDSPSLLKQELAFPMEYDVCCEPITTSALIIVDTDRFTVSVKSLAANSTRVVDSGPVKPSLGLHKMLMSLHYLIQLGMPPVSCLAFLETGLQKLERSGRALGAFLRSHSGSDALSGLQLASTVRADISDLPLLLSVASTQYKYVDAVQQPL